MSAGGCVRQFPQQAGHHPARRISGVDGEVEVLKNSPLIERIELAPHGTVKMWFKGFAWAFLDDEHDHGISEHDRGTSKPSLSETARRRIESVEGALKGDPFRGSLVIVFHDGLARYGGMTGLQEARAQIEHVRRGGDLDSLPAGPLRSTDPFLQGLLQAVKSKSWK